MQQILKLLLNPILKLSNWSIFSTRMVTFHKVHEGLSGESELRIRISNHRFNGLEKTWVHLSFRVALSVKALTFPPSSSIFACKSVQHEHDILILISKSKSLRLGQCALPLSHGDGVDLEFSSSSSSLPIPSIYVRATIEHDVKRIFSLKVSYPLVDWYNHTNTVPSISLSLLEYLFEWASASADLACSAIRNSLI